MKARLTPKAFLALCRRACALASLVLILPIACNRDKSAGAKSAAGPLGNTNLLIITLDTTRADRIGCYGHASAQTPTIDALAANGVLFEHTISQVPMTLPAHATIMSGLYPREHGVRVNGENSVPDEVTTLAERFRERGFRTGAFVAAYVLHSVFGLNQGFDTFDDDIERTGDDRQNLAAERPGNEITDRALDWLSTQSNKPFFCWVHYYDPHDPYEPPPPFSYSVGDPYDGEIAFVDAQVKRLMDWLDKQGLKDNTLIVVVGDHGEAFGEHKEHGHVMFLYETNVHVPFIVNHPRVAKPGSRVDTVVELTDIAPTIAELYDLPAITASGRSLVPALRAEPLEPRPAFAESDYPQYSFGWAQQRSITTDRWKYVSSTKPELFDIDADPAELRNLLGDEPETAQRLADALQHMYDSMTPTSAASVTLDEEARRRLESLGYAASGSTAGTDELLTPGLPDPKEVYHIVTDLNKARALTKKRKWIEALPLLQQAAQKSPGAYNICELLAKCYEELGRLDDAIDSWKESLKANPGHLYSINSLSELLLKTRRTQEAIDHLDAALAIDERSARAHEMLARAYLQADKLEDAERHTSRALELSPTYVPAIINHGTILAHQGRTDEAIRQFKKVLERWPDQAEALANATKLLRDQGKVGEMASVLRNALERQPDNIRFVSSLAQILACARDDSVRDGKQALRLALHAIDLSIGENPEVIALLAAAYAENGDWEQAIATATRALAIARQEGASTLAQRIESQLSGYRTQKPYRDPNL